MNGEMKKSDGKIMVKKLYRKYGIVIIFVMLFVASAVINRNFLKPQNLINILRQISVVTIIACGETMLIVSGMIDLSAGLICTTAMCFSAGVPSVGDGYEFDAITAVIVGGTSFLGGIGTVSGTLVGSIIVGLINNILNLLHISTQYQLIVKGVLIAGAVIIDIQTKENKN